MRWPDRGQAILALARAGMDACWLYLPALILQLLLARQVEPGWVLSPLLLGVIQLLGWEATRRLIRSQRLGDRGRALAGASGIIVGVAALEISRPGSVARAVGGDTAPLMLAVALAFAAWARGLALARETITFDTVYRAFRLGIGVFLAVALMTALEWLPHAAAGEDLGPLALAFFCLALVGLAAGNLVARADYALADDRPPRFNLRWGAVLLASVLAVLFAGGIGVAAGFERFAGAIQSAAVTIWSLIAWVLAWILFAVVWLLYTLIFDPLARLIAMLRRDNPPEPRPALTPPAPLELDWGESAASPGVDLPLAWPATILLVALLLLVAWLVLRRLDHLDKEESDLQRESLGGWDLLLAQLLAWLRRLLGRNQTSAQAAGGPRTAHVETRPDYAEVLSIRRIYGELQRRAAAAGHPRDAAKTPDEYLRELEEHFPAAASDLSALTRAYDAARYGPPPLPLSLVAEANERWRHARALINQDSRDGSHHGDTEARRRVTGDE